MSEFLSPEVKNFAEKKNEIIERFHEDVELVRELSREQVDIWKRVPYWALMAQGRDGYAGYLQSAYQDGLWRVGPARNSFYVTAVDLDNGEIVSLRNPQELASEEDMLRLVASGLEQIDAESVLSQLTDAAVQPVRQYASKTPEELAAWHREQMEIHNVSEYYVRQNEITREEMSSRMSRALGEV